MLQVALDVNAILAGTDGEGGFDEARNGSSWSMYILSLAHRYGHRLGIELYTCNHVEGQVRKALSERRVNRFGTLTRPAWSRTDIDRFVKFYKTAVTRTGGSNQGIAPAWNSTAADAAVLRGTPDREDGVMLASALLSPATVLCTEDVRFREETNTLDLVWNSGEARIFDFWTVEELAEECQAAEAAVMALKNAA
jgi:hypothetical protein